ncbi:hypothetical protein PsorP6_002574 [Peronosclerospora sorghi]|uniref:Uncharacterized protein n=1 Tax=Peronosclerospora sorghi TaxID=230839 RepID=A0ACC0WSJ5_9STRA|nr:hypothetical protein PsorP6_002574 [Peronosclerospora sorghi]
MLQVAIRLLSTVIDAFDPNSVAAVGPLQQVVAIMEKIEPLALFTEWSPPRLLSQEKVVPVKVTSSSAFDDQHRASQCVHSYLFLAGVKKLTIMLTTFFCRILENGLTFWRSAKKANGNIPPSEEWLLCQFSSAVTISFIELKWHVNLLPGRFSVSISRDGSTFDTVAVVLIRNPESQILLPKGTLIISLKITMFLSEMDAGKTIGLVSITFKKALCSSVYTSTRLVLRNIQYWLQDATVSSLPDVRDLALQALQKFLLASGSLCGLLDLAACLLFNTRFGATVASCKIDMQAWNQLDLLSEVGQSAAQEFVKKLAASIQRIVNWGSSHVNVSDNPVIDTLVLFHEKNYPAESDTTCKLGMVVLHMLSEISAWQMKRMQKGEEFTGKQELQLMHLEEPFSMEICPDFFGISNQLLVTILARWLPDTTQQQSKSKKDHGEDSCFRDLYDALSSSFELFWLNTEGLGDQIGISSNSAKHFGHSKFSPDGVCVAVLEIISPHLRRLVLSRIDPLDTGITQVAVQNKDNLMSAPPVLSPIVSSLEKLISLGTKRSDAFFPLSLKAAAAMETGTEAFYPSPHQRTKVLAARMGKGATLEVQVRWPAQEYEQEDPRYERLILMLQLECIKLGIRHVIRGSWYFFIHLLVDVPSLRDTEEFLTQHFASCIQRAGFLSWQVAAGAQELSIHLQRHLHWNRADMSQDSGVGWIRVYPADVAAYDEVLVDVEDFLTDHARYRIAMARP